MLGAGARDRVEEPESTGRQTNALLLIFVFSWDIVTITEIESYPLNWVSEDHLSHKLLPVTFIFQIAFAMFGVYVMQDDRNVLDAQKVFVSMALINILKTPLSQLPFAISTTMQVGDILMSGSGLLRGVFLIDGALRICSIFDISHS